MKLKNVVLALIFSGLLATINIPAQFIPIKATISGQVINESGRGVGLARIEVVNLITLERRERRTNYSGYFRFDNLQLGDLYYVEASGKNLFFDPRFHLIDLQTTEFKIVFNAIRGIRE